MDWFNISNVFIAIEILEGLLTITGLLLFAYACVASVRVLSKGFKEIESMSKRLEILMNMPLKQAREILKGKKED